MSGGSAPLPYSMRDVDGGAYNNAKFRQRSRLKMVTQALISKSSKYQFGKFTLGKFLSLLMVSGLIYLVAHKSSKGFVSGELHDKEVESRHASKDSPTTRTFWRKPPRLPPRLPPNEIYKNSSMLHHPPSSEWTSRQKKVKEAFGHAWSGYRNYAMGHDELMPLSRRGVDGLGGLGATVVDSLDTAIIMGADDIVSEASKWIEDNLMKKISEKGQVNLFETTIRVLGGLLSAYHLSGGDQAGGGDSGIAVTPNKTNPDRLLAVSKDLADRLLLAFTSSPSAIPFSDVVLRDRSAHASPDGLSSTSEATTLQLEFSYLSRISGDPKYDSETMKVLEHMRTLPTVEGLVPIYINPYSGQFSGENIRLGSRGDSYYEYLLKVWMQQENYRNTSLKYLFEMYTEAMKGVKHLLVRKTTPNGLVFVGELPNGRNGAFSPKMDHLVCFLPGTLALGATKGITKKKALESNLLTNEDIENLQLAEDLAKTCVEMYFVTSTGLAPEIAYFHIEGNPEGGPDGGNKSSEYISDITIKPLDRHNLLRPETVESLFVLHRITEDPKYREWGWQIFQAFEKYTKVDSGGYTSLDDVTSLPPPRRDKMETFFLGETLKYLYLLFGESNILPLDKYVFNTEAHPLPVIPSVVQVYPFSQENCPCLFAKTLVITWINSVEPHMQDFFT
ncbi:mannosyl-oligosaccharide 1,2-alpha-mannosidase MNS3 isoform X2 [Hordeum vulgare subsp. vulgare]|uniref:mannosyl-oligosaccharide 1,2-alpha-mannosidase MNS3 isoform X2 n=1 Tax=Hordeum vulgare subsp. vulgare TaxID=112509 RepID=UPI001D1A57F0|nr:mannosyl-oligosaccharide 1,2-alpha-mannosidase MNS3 isoform X2 [Hordeum vulgare subsp. vulgare]